DDVEGIARSIGLLVVTIAPLGEDRDGFRYSLVLEPPEALLAHASGYRIFLEKTAPEIVQEMLEAAGLGGARLSARLAGSYELRRQCTQYAETHWAFIERLLAEEGISYWFDASESGPALVIGDHPGSHEGLTGGTEVVFDDPSGMVRPRSLFELEL